MNNDRSAGPLQNKKGIHIELDVDLYAAFKECLKKNGLTIQVLYAELARCLVSNDQRMLEIISELKQKRLIERVDMRTKLGLSINELDPEALYDIIGSQIEIGAK